MLMLCRSPSSGLRCATPPRLSYNVPLVCRISRCHVFHHRERCRLLAVILYLPTLSSGHGFLLFARMSLSSRTAFSSVLSWTHCIITGIDWMLLMYR
ncbi:hypothetical protein BD626DRAFT_525360 [Schizophyllum amplum]|uniref:Uncharacterized protein n=1 Tax=Schizophyllum amplum TaxID=97359 RepID=A0A550BSH0_9AGAR|nr:hypothetical protein BD626DRAFT_525360 [Auriculariopsis ampla]